MRALIALFVFAATSFAFAADAIVHDGESIIVDDTRYRLDGIDAPERDQICLDEKGQTWACGVEARDQLESFIAKRAVRCDDKGPDPAYPRRRIGECWVEGEAVSLNEWLVREGWALNFEPSAKGRFLTSQADAMNNLQNLWRGCFSSPQDFRRGNKSKAQLLGPNCQIVGDKNARDRLFPDDPAMPPGCPIKAKFALRAKISGHVGIYHMPGCRTYQRTKFPNRWFCSESDAQAEKFRKALNC